MLSVCFFLFLSKPDFTAQLVQRVARSGRVLEIAIPLTDRISPAPEIAPGAPPLLGFRLFEGQQRHRFSNTDLVLDDAGH